VSRRCDARNRYYWDGRRPTFSRHGREGKEGRRKRVEGMQKASPTSGRAQCFAKLFIKKNVTGKMGITREPLKEPEYTGGDAQ